MRRVGEIVCGNALLKHDFLGDSTRVALLRHGKALGEFIFHPSSPDAAEDDGVLMGYVYDRATDRSELAILDAQTLQDVGEHQVAAPSARRVLRQLGTDG